MKAKVVRLVVLACLLTSAAFVFSGCDASVPESVPTVAPTVAPTMAPTIAPPIEATALPTVEPTVEPTGQSPLWRPLLEPTEAPKRILRETIPAPSLAANLVGEEPQRMITVFLPPSYATSDKRYPVVYYLPGYGDSDFIGMMPNRDTDPLIESGALPEIIFVVANGVSALGGSFYANSPVTGNWEDFIAKDLVEYVDATYRTLPQAASRGIAGHSMGGYGALNAAMKHPDVFGSVYSMSPGLFDENGLAESQMFSNDRIIQAYIDMDERLTGEDEAAALHDMLRQYSDLGFAVAYGATFAPNPDRHPPYIDYPYHMENGNRVLDDSVWARWQSGYGGIAEGITQYADNLRSLRGLVVDYGTRDGYAWIPKGAAYLDAQLTAAGIPHESRAFDGGHQDQLGKRLKQQMLPFFAETLAVE